MRAKRSRCSLSASARDVVLRLNNMKLNWDIETAVEVAMEQLYGVLVRR